MGDSHRDRKTLLELQRAGIIIATKPSSIFAVYGVLGPHSFFRGPRHYLAKGDVPLDTALLIYQEPQYRSYLTIAGLNEKARPDDRSPNKNGYLWAKIKNFHGKEEWIVPFYCISSLDALRFFVGILKSNGLV